MRKLLVLGLSLAVLAAAACGRDADRPGSVWQWVDAKGSVQFAENLDDVPEAYRSKAGKIPMSAKAVARKRSGSTPADEPKLEKASTRGSAAATAAVAPATLYVSSLFDNHTAPTVQALEEAGIDFKTIDVEKDESAMGHLKERTHQQWPDRDGDDYAVPMLEHEDWFFFGDGAEPARLLAVHLDWVRRGRPMETPAVFITTSCGYSKALIADLDRLGQPYDALDIEADNDAAGRLMDATGSVGVPVTIVNGQVIHGYGPETAKEIAAASHRAPVRGGIGEFFKTLLGS